MIPATTTGAQLRIVKETKGCKSCGAPIFFAITRTGKRIPMDARQVEGGRFCVVERAGIDDSGDINIIMAELHAVYINAHELHMFEQKYKRQPVAYISHFSTCPHATRHRGGWRKEGSS